MASNKWVSALSEPMAGLNTLGTCLGLADLVGDGDQKLVLADLGTGRYNMRLKVFKGVILTAESALVEAPAALVAFFMETVDQSGMGESKNLQSQPSIPAIAIASGASIFVYKNLKPYYKFLVPSLEVNEVELEAWKRVSSTQIDAPTLHSILTGMRGLTARSQRFLLIEGGDSEREHFIDRYRSEPLRRQDVITAMTTMKKSSAEETAIDCIVCATETGLVYVIDAQAFTVLATFSLPSPPVFLVAAGVYDVDYRIIASCRDAGVYILKRGMGKLDSPTFKLKSHIVGIVKLAVACLDQTLHYFSLKGRHLNKVQMECRICAIEVFNYRPREYTGTLIALENGEKIDQPANWIKFGRFGREDGALIIGTKSGGLQVKLFRRTAKLDERSQQIGPPAAQMQKLAVPKKTKIFVDQTIREREQARKMHLVFQRDLFMLRLHTAEAFAQLLGVADENSTGTIEMRTNEAVEVSVAVHGFGPCFEMIITVMSTKRVLKDLFLSFQYPPSSFALTPGAITVPLLVPTLPYEYMVNVKSLQPEKALSETIKVILTGANSQVPLLIAVVSMPLSELPLLD